MYSMNTSKQHNLTVAIIATGDEIVRGDIRNSNSEYIAQQCVQLGLTVASICAVSDDRKQISDIIATQWQQYDIIFTIGGLGPTTDDITRHAIAEALQQPLTYHEPSWQHIHQRVLQHTGKEPPASNKQQAYFPQPCEVISNQHGTANGCFILHNPPTTNQPPKMLWMLPGPPKECIAMFQQHCLAILQTYATTFFFQSWLTLGIGEGQLSEMLKTLEKPDQYQLGYRYDFPYVELKCYSRDEDIFNTVCQHIDNLLPNNQVISKHAAWASQQLRLALDTPRFSIDTITICDQVTHGLLQSLLGRPNNSDRLIFSNTPSNDSYTIQGLAGYWDPTQTAKEYTLSLLHNNKIIYSYRLLNYDERTLITVCEWVCYWLLQQLLPFP